MKPEARLIRKLQDRLNNAQEALWNAQTAYLESTDWKYTNDTPGCIWLWQKTLDDGRTMLCDVHRAVWIQEELDSQRFDEAEEDDS